MITDEEHEEEMQVLREENQFLRATVNDLKYLKKFEGQRVAESDKIGHEAEVAVLKAEIARLQIELEEAKRR